MKGRPTHLAPQVVQDDTSPRGHAILVARAAVAAYTDVTKMDRTTCPDAAVRWGEFRRRPGLFRLGAAHESIDTRDVWPVYLAMTSAALGGDASVLIDARTFEVLDVGLGM